MTTNDERANTHSTELMPENSANEPSKSVTALKFVAASVLLMSAASLYGAAPSASLPTNDIDLGHRRLSSVSVGSSIPSYMKPLMDDLTERKKLMEETPKEEVKYWFEYTGPLQKYFYRYSKSRQKADYFEGRDDSGVISSRFLEEAGGNTQFTDFFSEKNIPTEEISTHARLLENCLAMGSPLRPDMNEGTLWNDWFGSGKTSTGTNDRCRILFTLNTVGAGRGSTMLWETQPPAPHAEGPKPWISEQETAATHLQRNLEEIDAMCATGQIAARVQLLVCEPIPAQWTEWMDSLLVNCGGKPGAMENSKLEERPSPIQVVVVAGSKTADTCHDQKSGFMEKRMQDLVLAPPYLGEAKGKDKVTDPAIKTTHRDLVSSDEHDMYVAFKWSSMVTTRAVHGFLQASADLSAGASSPNNQKVPKPEKTADGVTVAISNSPSSPFLIPSFVRVSYVSEENSKVAKWRMHGDFFHPAAWEVCKDSYDMTWIPDSLSGSGGVNDICNSSDRKKNKEDCGQWWVYMAEEQMPTSPEVYSNEVTPTIVEGGSNYIWMITERQRREIVKIMICENGATTDEAKKKCGQHAQAVIPLGDMESFLINFSPNTALGKQHIKGRRPGYSREKERELDRKKVRERKQLKGQEEIEKALFDYTIYPAALFHKDATIKAARARDAVLTKNADKESVGPQTVKSSYYDVTITKPREATLAWCQAMSRSGLCTLYADYFRTSNDHRCLEACGMKKDFSKV